MIKLIEKLRSLFYSKTGTKNSDLESLKFNTLPLINFPKPRGKTR